MSVALAVSFFRELISPIPVSSITRALYVLSSSQEFILILTPVQERHFHTAHHPCTYPSCLAQKFVVFGTPLDLKAHMVETHGTDMTARDRKEAMRIQADFEFEEVGAGGRRAGGRRDRDREPPQPPPRQQQQPRPPAAPGPSRPPGGGRRREGFGASLTVAGGSGSATPNGGTPAGPSRRASPSPPRADVDPAVLEYVLDRSTSLPLLIVLFQETRCFYRAFTFADEQPCHCSTCRQIRHSGLSCFGIECTRSHLHHLDSIRQSPGTNCQHYQCFRRSARRGRQETGSS